ncbi:MAG: GNAT family N-acetyltransferase, partial [Rhodoplanes sp.]
TPYYQRKVEEVLQESGVRVSLVAEIDDHPVGFIMARVDFGEFGRTEPEAVMDTVGVHPDYAHRGASASR